MRPFLIALCVVFACLVASPVQAGPCRSGSCSAVQGPVQKGYGVRERKPVRSFLRRITGR